MRIQWYPGHMAKAKRLLQEQLKLVDLIIEIRDARIPVSSSNRDLLTLAAGKRHIVALNKSDLAEPVRLAAWTRSIRREVDHVVATDSMRRKGMKEIVAACRSASQDMLKQRRSKGLRPRAVRAMVIGVPNVGKSSFINALVRKGMARTGNKPGVTRGNQWVRILDDLELMDTPGILWPRFEDERTGELLVFTGAISERIFEAEEAAHALVALLCREYPGVMASYAGVDETDPVQSQLAAMGRNMHFLDAHREVQWERTALRLLHDFQKGKLGRFTLDVPDGEHRP